MWDLPPTAEPSGAESENQKMYSQSDPPAEPRPLPKNQMIYQKSSSPQGCETAEPLCPRAGCLEAVLYPLFPQALRRATNQAEAETGRLNHHLRCGWPGRDHPASGSAEPPGHSGILQSQLVASNEYRSADWNEQSTDSNEMIREKGCLEQRSASMFFLASGPSSPVSPRVVGSAEPPLHTGLLGECLPRQYQIP